MRTAVFTIASKNYFAFVKTLMQSLEESNPEYDRFVGICDSVTNVISDEATNFRILSLEDFELPEKSKMLFRYNVLELNTAIKPFVFNVLFEKFGYDRVIYFDPDIYVYQKLSLIEDLFSEGYEIVLTPHLTGQYNDANYTPNDLDIMKSGAYNLGFLALNKGYHSMALVCWWKQKLEYQCVASFKDGLFVDQKWMDLVPGMFDNVYILRNAGYNVAYWNLSHRTGALDKSGNWYFNSDPMIFFHFSGLNPKDITGVSKYQNRFNINNIGDLRYLFEDYAKKVLNNGYDYFRNITYAYNYFNDGSCISNLLRIVYRSDQKLQSKCGSNPFSAVPIFYEDRVQILSKLMEVLWYEREDVRMIYPNVNSGEYAKWFLKAMKKEYEILPRMLEDVTINDILKAENQKRMKTSGKYKVKNFVKQHSTETTWEFYRKFFRKFWNR